MMELVLLRFFLIFVKNNTFSSHLVLLNNICMNESKLINTFIRFTFNINLLITIIVYSFFGYL